MLNLLIRTIVIYIAVIVVMRLMGKRQLSELQPFEIVITIIIADLASLPMQDEQIPLLRGIFTLVALFFAQSILSLLVFKHKKFRAWLNGTPTILIANGAINHTAMQKLMISFSDMLEAMHGKDISDLSKIDYAIMETNGTINIFQKPEKEGEDFSCPLIINGELLQNYMQFSGITEQEIQRNLSQEKHTLEDVLFAYRDSNGKFQSIYKRK